MSKTFSFEPIMFSIFIPTWKNPKYLAICLESVLEHSSYNHEVLVHVNENDTESITILKELNIKYTSSDENIGICKALNRLANIASNEYYLYLNDDMYVLPKWDEYLAEEISKLKTDKFYLSATMIEPKKGGHNCMIAPKDYGDLEKGFDRKELLKDYEKFDFRDWNGATWPPSLVHKKWWNKVGGYSEEFSPGLYSDPDFSMKLWKEGVRIFKGLGNSRVYHFQSKSLHRVKLNNGNKQFKKKWGIPASFFYKNTLLMGKKYTGPLSEQKKDLKYWFAKLITKLDCLFTKN